MTRTLRQIEEHRKGDAVIHVRDEAGRPCAGLAVWVEQEAHEFLFGCVVPAPATLPGTDRPRYQARLEEVFNRLEPAADALRVDVMERAHLGVLRRDLDRLAVAGRPLEVHVCGRTVGMTDRDERDGARRLADLYTLCFAHPAVWGIFWHGFRDGEEGAAGGGLLRRDLSPKPAHRVLQKLIGVIWHTREAGRSDPEGQFHFRGFRGAYRVAVMAGTQAARVACFALRSLPGTPASLLIEMSRDSLTS